MENNFFPISAAKPSMGIPLFSLWLLFLYSCSSSSSPALKSLEQDNIGKQHIAFSKKFDETSWKYFLQNLPVTDNPILDYTGNKIFYQAKHTAIVLYDVGKSDLQQCADALMRLRAEYLFKQHRYSEIGFHFVSGHYYSWNDYCKGLRPIAKENHVNFITVTPCSESHETLRKYLDIVYAYASTISLAKELQTTSDFAVGTVIIHPGSPGHCFIIVDEAINTSGEKVFKLVEGYTPAQSIYVLRNIWEDGITPWYNLKKGVIKTASYEFTDYKMGKFE